MDMNSRKLDTEKREQGDWVSEIPEWGDLRLKVRGIGNSDFRRLQAKLIETVPRQKRMRGVIEPEEQDRITSRCLLNTVLLDWENVSEDGKPVPFTKEAAERYLTDPAYEAFREAVAWAGRMVAERAADDEEDALGKLIECLQWSLTWGPRAKPGGYLDTLKRYDQPLPDEYLDRPEVRPELTFFWNAFSALGTDRQIGMGEGPIPFSAVDRYARRYGIESIDEFDYFAAIIRALDGEYLSFRSEQSRHARELNEEFRKEQGPPKPVPKMLSGEG